MKHAIKFISLSLLLVGILFVCITCKEKPPQEPEIIYYDVIGIGYAFMYDESGSILYPLKGVSVKVISTISWRDVAFTTSSPEEVFYSDATGKYRVRFIKRYKGDDVERYDIFRSYREWQGHLGFSVDKVKNAQSTIKLDTFKMYINEIKY